MKYTYNRLLPDVPIDEADSRTREALKEQGFGVLTEIDVKETMKKKIGAEMDGYRILGACNPTMAHQAIGIEPRVGAMLPCNVIVRAVPGDEIMVSAIDPVASMQAIPNRDLAFVADQVRDMLKAAVEDI